jgi:crotonobetainyl-CoA:carnitine CoA-transferase CaiB-like acyl-CoA transferase
MTTGEGETAAELPYAGLTVLDLSQGVAGPYCGSILALQGADVIKVEPPAGDWCRSLGRARDGLGALAIAANLGKRSLAVDATRADGRALLLDLAIRADVLLESFRPGVVAKLGLDYASMSARNPALVYASITAYGDSGPWARKAGTDSVLQAHTGMTVMNRDGSGAPRRVGLLVPDTVTALYAVQAIQAALYARLRSGRGRHVRLSLAECCAAFQTAPMLDATLFPGATPPNNVPAGVFRTADGFVVLLALHDAMWVGVCKALGRQDWLDDPANATHAQRAARCDAINAEVATQLAGRSSAAWVEVFERHDVLCAEVLDYAGFRAHAQTRHMGWFGALDQPPYERVDIPRLPAIAQGGPIPRAPRAGEHTREVLRAFGRDADAIAALERDGIVRQG